jgi:hypothetical protein
LTVAHRIQLRARNEHLFTYSGRSVLVTDLAGRIARRDPLGLYVDNTRVLSRFEVTVDGHPLRPISASPVGGDAFLAYEEVPESDGIPRESVYLETTRFVGEGMRILLRLRNHAAGPARGRVAIAIEADFADSEEAEHSVRRQTADTETTWDSGAN